MTVTRERRQEETPDARTFFVSMTEWGRWETINGDGEDAVDGTVAAADAVESARTVLTFSGGKYISSLIDNQIELQLI